MVEDFEEHLDIRNFVGVHKKLSLALWMLFTKDQMLLFSHHRELAVQSGSDTPTRKGEKLHVTSKPPVMNLSANKGDSKKTKKALKNLLGFQVETTLDRQLLMGIFDETKVMP